MAPGDLMPVALDVPAQAVAIAAVGSHSGLALGVSDALSAAVEGQAARLHVVKECLVGALGLLRALGVVSECGQLPGG